MADLIVSSGSSTVLGAGDVAYINGFASSFRVKYNKEDGVITLTNKSNKTVTYEFSAAAGSKLAFLNGAVTVSAAGKISLTKKSIDAAVNSQESFNVVAPAAFTLTESVDAIAGTKANETIKATLGADATLSIYDVIDGGAGTDTLAIVDKSGAALSALPTGVTVSNVEKLNITKSGAVGGVTVDKTWGSFKEVVVADASGSSVTVQPQVSTLTPTEVSNGLVAGTDVATFTYNGISLTTAAVATADVAGVGAAIAAAINAYAGSSIASAHGTTGVVTVTANTPVSLAGFSVTGGHATVANALTTGYSATGGTGSRGAMSVTQASADSVTVSGGTTVAVTDNSTDATLTGSSLKTVNLADNTGTATLTGNGISTIGVSGATGTLGTVNVTAAAGTRALTVNFSGAATKQGLTDNTATSVTVNNSGTGALGTVTAGAATSMKFDTSAVNASGTLAGAEVTSLSINSTASTGPAALTLTNANLAKLATITVTGAGGITADVSDIAALTSVNTTGASATKTSAGTITIGTGVTFTGGAGVDKVSVGASTKDLTLGAGDDTLTLSASALGATSGTADGGAGTDTLSMTFANAVTASASTTLAAKISGFEKLKLDANTASAPTINMANLDNINYVILAGNTDAATISGLASGSTLEFTAAQTDTKVLTAVVTGADSGTNESITLALTNSSATNFHDVTVANVENINIITSDDVDTPATGIQHTLELLADKAKVITVSGDAGLVLTDTTDTKITTLDASGVTKGAVSFTSGALAPAVTGTRITVKGGAGGDTLNLASSTVAADISGGAGADVITSTAFLDTLTGGSGADEFIITGGANGNTYATIADFAAGLGGDSIALDGIAAVGTSTTVTKVTLADTAAFADYLDAAAAGNGTTDTNGAAGDGDDTIVKFFNYGGNTYLVLDNSADATFKNGSDFVVKLTGVFNFATGAAISAGENLTLA